MRPRFFPSLFTQVVANSSKYSLCEEKHELHVPSHRWVKVHWNSCVTEPLANTEIALMHSNTQGFFPRKRGLKSRAGLRKSQEAATLKSSSSPTALQASKTSHLRSPNSALKGASNGFPLKICAKPDPAGLLGKLRPYPQDGFLLEVSRHPAKMACCLLNWKHVYLHFILIIGDDSPDSAIILNFPSPPAMSKRLCHGLILGWFLLSWTF